MLRFAAASFLGSFLLFLVQPLLAKQILPWFGGAQSVWTTSLLFYQTLLLAGYVYAHLSRRLGPTAQPAFHTVLLLLSVSTLPITVSAGWKPEGSAAPTGWLLALLTATVGGPYFLLASTTPLLHDWFGRRSGAASPYPLYAVSNAGSMLALVVYPVLVEPFLGAGAQSLAWSIAYGGFVVAAAALSLSMTRVRHPYEGSATTPRGRDPVSRPRPSPWDVARWLTLSATGSGLLLAVTHHVTQDVASVPLLWVSPLVLYLLSLVLAFAGRYSRRTWGALLVLALGVMALLWNWGFALPLGVQVLAGLGVLLAGCMVCHGELARSAPSRQLLTTFYLTMATGGALGGAGVALLAPALLSDYWELPGLLLLAYTLLVIVLVRESEPSHSPRIRQLRFAVLCSVFAVATAAFVASAAVRRTGTVDAARNFYGVLRVRDAPPGRLAGLRVLYSGRIVHGGQHLNPRRAREATTYFTEESGVALALRHHPRRTEHLPLEVGVIGLGVGTVAAWGSPGDRFRFYEINPAAEAFARRYFTFLADGDATVHVSLGDARLSLEREFSAAAGSARFDLLVVDAFSGDAVPTHLLTREAGELYARATKEDGIMAFNVTNRHVDLRPVVRGLAVAIGAGWIEISSGADAGAGEIRSSWILVSRADSALERVRPGLSVAREAGRVTDPTLLWTDDRSSILAVLR